MNPRTRNRRRSPRALVKSAGRTRWGSVFLSVDFIVAIACGALAAAAALIWHLGEWPSVVLLTLAGGMLALLAVIVTAAAVLAGLVSDSYLALLERAPGGLEGVTRPFNIVARVCAAAALLGFGCALIWPAAESDATARALVMFTSVMPCAWAIVGSAQLIEQSLFHVRSRGQLAESIHRIRGRTKAS